MKRFLRRMFSAMAALSALLCVLTLAVAVLMQFKHVASISYEAYRLYAIQFGPSGCDAGIYSSRMRTTTTTPYTQTDVVSPFRSSPLFDAGWYRWDLISQSDSLGIREAESGMRNHVISTPTGGQFPLLAGPQLCIPYWLPLLITGIIPAWWILRYDWRKRSRRRRGFPIIETHLEDVAMPKRID